MLKKLKDERIVVIGGFFPDLAVWNRLLASAGNANVSMTQSYLSEKLHCIYFQLEVSGTWSELAKFESALKLEQAKLDEHAVLQFQRAELPMMEELYLPYIVQATTLTNHELVTLFTDFFSVDRIKIKEVTLHRYIQSKTFIPLQLITLSVWLPIDINLPDIRENFMILCEQYNIDAIFEQDRM